MQRPATGGLDAAHTPEQLAGHAKPLRWQTDAVGCTVASLRGRKIRISR